jgi:hypothetical protein
MLRKYEVDMGKTKLQHMGQQNIAEGKERTSYPILRSVVVALGLALKH